MINIKHLLKVSMAWTSIMYAICYAGVVAYPPIRDLFMRYSLHANLAITSSYFGLGYFVSGLIIWNITVCFSVWLFALLFNKTK